MTESPYLARVAARALNKATQRCAAVGVTIGAALFSVALYMYYLVPHVNDRLWRTGIEAGLAILLLALFAPTALLPLEFAVRKAGHLLFYAVLLLFLTAVYFVFLLPIGLVLRRQPKYALTVWDDAAPAFASRGWQDKRLRETLARPGATRRPIILLPLVVISYFVQERQYVLVPLVLLLLLAGLAMLFLQTSALAPFIYTLF